MPPRLQQLRYSLAHQQLFDTLAREQNLLIIQDLDGVCMGLVRDPKTRRLAPEYIEACKHLAGMFYVLTNGEHVGSRGVNGLVERAFADRPADYAAREGLYLPGLAAGGVQLQDCFGNLSHPGISEPELAFLAAVPALMRAFLDTLLSAPPYRLAQPEIRRLLDVIVLDNAVSPTVNIGVLFDVFAGRRELYDGVQKAAADLMLELLQRARAEGLGDAFFVHLAPNLGTVDGMEVPRPRRGEDMGTTDFQFMVRGAVKEVGVLVLLNHHFYAMTGHYPLGADFNARRAPRERAALLQLAADHFDPALMPRIFAVGDTVTSSPPSPGESSRRRGGSDRGFLTLVQALGAQSGADNAVALVDSSGGELNRPGVSPPPQAGADVVPLASLEGITDADDPLKINVVFPGGHRQYSDFLVRLARERGAGRN